MPSATQGSSALLGDQALRAMFEARKSVFIDLLKWDVPVLDGRFEMDQFDDEHAHYLILTTPQGEHLGSARLLPTERPHILGDLFPQLCAGPVPRGRHIMEITRFCLSRGLRAAERRRVRDRLVHSLVRYALDNDIRIYTGVADTPWLKQILGFGWRCRPLGVPMRVGNHDLGALRIEIDPATPQEIEPDPLIDHERHDAGDDEHGEAVHDHGKRCYPQRCGRQHMVGMGARVIEHRRVLERHQHRD